MIAFSLLPLPPVRTLSPSRATIDIELFMADWIGEPLRAYPLAVQPTTRLLVRID